MVDLAVVGDLDVVDVDRVGSVGRSVPALRQGLRAGSESLDLFRVGSALPGRVAQEVGGDRCCHLLHAVRRGPRQVENEALVDLGLDVEHVAELVDPVVQVHNHQGLRDLPLAATPEPPEPSDSSPRRSSSVSIP